MPISGEYDMQHDMLLGGDKDEEAGYSALIWDGNVTDLLQSELVD